MMVRSATFAFALLFAASPAFASTCPPVPDHTKVRSALMAELKSAPSERAARTVENAIWPLWLKAPDKKAQSLLDKGMERRRAYDYEAAEAALDELVAYCPHYPEAYNQRAFVRFLRDKYDASLEDADKTLELMPNHFGALSGKARILFRMGRVELSQKALRDAVKIYPFIQDRHMLPRPKGEDL